MPLVIKTNNHWYDLISVADLTDKEQKEFDYITGDDRFSPRVVRYKGHVYDLNEFMPCSTLGPGPELEGIKTWSGYQADSYFSGVVCRYSEDFQQAQMGTYYY